MQVSLRKSAIVLQSVPWQEASGLLAGLPDPQRQALIDALARLGPWDSDEQAAVAREFRAAVESGAAVAFQEAADSELTEDSPVTLLAARLGSERQQTQAAVLACLPRNQAETILDSLPVETRQALRGRIASLATLSAEVLRQLESGLGLARGTLVAPGHSAETTRSVSGM